MELILQPDAEKRARSASARRGRAASTESWCVPLGGCRAFREACRSLTRLMSDAEMPRNSSGTDASSPSSSKWEEDDSLRSRLGAVSARDTGTGRGGDACGGGRGGNAKAGKVRV
jgi:hypothetical protein